MANIPAAIAALDAIEGIASNLNLTMVGDPTDPRSLTEYMDRLREDIDARIGEARAALTAA